MAHQLPPLQKSTPQPKVKRTTAKGFPARPIRLATRDPRAKRSR